jgi:hypothetical protein
LVGTAFGAEGVGGLFVRAVGFTVLATIFATTPEDFLAEALTTFFGFATTEVDLLGNCPALTSGLTGLRMADLPDLTAGRLATCRAFGLPVEDSGFRVGDCLGLTPPALFAGCCNNFFFPIAWVPNPKAG